MRIPIDQYTSFDLSHTDPEIEYLLVDGHTYRADSTVDFVYLHDILRKNGHTPTLFTKTHVEVVVKSKTITSNVLTIEVK